MRSNSKIYELVNSLNSLPGIGKKSAIRLAYSLLDNRENAYKLLNSIEEAIVSVHSCSECGNVSENEICYICSDEFRDKEIVCLVESSKDIYILEENKFYKGLYFVIGETMDDASVRKLKKLILNNNVKEITFALTPTIANDMLVMFIEDKLKEFDLSFYKIAQGVPSGVSLENVDSVSLDRAFNNKIKA